MSENVAKTIITEDVIAMTQSPNEDKVGNFAELTSSSIENIFSYRAYSRQPTN